MKSRFSVFSLLILILMLSGCKSLPLPGSPTESLFIMSGTVDKNFRNESGENRSIDRVLLTLENMETGKSKQITYYPNKSFIALPMEPGRYRILRRMTIEVNNGKGSWTENRDANFSPFLIQETTVFISNTVFVLKKNSRGWFDIRPYNDASNTNPVRKKAVEEVFNDRRYKAWENYQVIGWNMDEE